MMPANPLNISIKLFRRIIPALFHRYTLFALLSIISCLIIFIHIKKFKSELDSTTISSEEYTYCYADLDQDGNSEKLQFISNYNDMLGLIVFHNDKIIEQWNFTGQNEFRL